MRSLFSFISAVLLVVSVSSCATEMHVLLMAYRRIESASKILERVRDTAANAACIRLIVSQNGAEGDEAVYSMRSVLMRYRAEFSSVEHTLTPLLLREGVGGHGSKRNALNNLLHGLRVGFRDVAGVASTSDYVPQLLVLEDDAVLSTDALTFFEFTAAHMRGVPGRRKSPSTVDFATARTLQRPSLLAGTFDDDLIAATRAWMHTPGSLARVVDAVTATPRTVFTTYAWMLSRQGFHQLEPLLQASLHHKPTPASGVAFAPPPPSPSPALGLRSAMSAHKTTPPPPQQLQQHLDQGDEAHVDWAPLSTRSTLPQLRGCVWCNDYCYDHIIEWLVQGHVFLAPAVDRVTQTSGGGMTRSVAEVNAIWEGPSVPAADFKIHSFAAGVTRVFPVPGLTGMAPLPPPAGDGLSISKFEVVVAFASEPLLQLAAMFLLAGVCAAVALRSSKLRRAAPLRKRE